jgi:alpha-L-rhamnosidase
MRNPYTFILLASLAVILNTGIVYGATGIKNLQTEYTTTPLVMDVAHPRFSWEMIAPEVARGVKQKAYQIKVHDPAGNLMWDTERTESDVSLAIRYKGEPLQPATRYTWSVTVWNQDDEHVSDSSWFETGLMNSDPELSAWNGAEWIGGSDSDLVLYSHYLSVFRVDYTLCLDEPTGSTRAGFILGANDNRLLDKNMNIYGIESGRDGHYVKLELDISGVDGSSSGLARFNIYRVGYHPDDQPDKPFYSIDIPISIINSENRYDPHTISIQSVFGSLTISINGTDPDHTLKNPRASWRGGGGFNINPSGVGGDYISFPMLADIGFSVDEGQKAHLSELAIIHYRRPSNTIFSEDLTAPDYHGIFTRYIESANAGFTVNNGRYVIDGSRGELFITANPSRNSMPMLRTEFSAEKGVQQARLYVTARGVYEIYLNGNRVGEDYFNPGLTQYNKTHMYQTYDVTSMIIPGEGNALGARLGEGWWSGNYTFTGSNWNCFGDRQSLLARLVITYKDGTVKIITSNDKEWKYYHDGPVIYGSFFQGEVYDAGKEAAIKNWSTAGYDDSAWKEASTVPLDGTAFTGSSTGFMGSASSIDYDSLCLTGQIGENATIVRTLKAQSMIEVRPGVFVYDMGQNMVGIPRITIRNGKPGSRIRLRYAEVLYPDLEEYQDNAGMVMLENIRAAHAQDLYIMKDGENIIQPHFTFHGYRFIEITGIDEALPPERVEGLVISSVKKQTASYVTSNEKVNRLWENIVWSQTGNFLSIPTDCPQRNERMGWSGDISVFSRTATYLADVNQFLKRHLLAMRDIQDSNGRFSDVAPVGSGFGGILWGSAGMTVAWEAYLQYGDIELLLEHYDAMKRYIEYLDTRIDEKTGVLTEGPLGDWLSPEGNKNDNSLLWEAYYLFDLEIMARVAEILNRSEDAARYWKKYKERKAHFNATYIDPETHKTIKSASSGSFNRMSRPGQDNIAREEENNGKVVFVDTQASYAVPLALGAFNEENRPGAAENLAKACTCERADDAGVMRPPGSMMTGFIGTAWISKALSDNGFNDVAYRLLQQESYPSWLYPVNQGATTIWERLNSYTKEDGFGGNNSMNSFNHYSFGAIGQWMMAYSAGIQRDESYPGFQHFFLQPEPDPTGKMKWVNGYYDSMYGRIESSWKIESGILTVRVAVPANTSATLYLPADPEQRVKESNKPVESAEGFIFTGYKKNKAVYELLSGQYEFTVSD